MATTKELNKLVQQLQARMNKMADEVHLLKTELKQFKTDVASDIDTVENRIARL